MGQLFKQERLQGVNPQLQYALLKAIVRLPFDVLVVQGLRSVHEQEKYIATGRSEVKDASTAPHVVGRAVDLVPVLNAGRQCDWKDMSKFDLIFDALDEELKKSGAELDSPIKWDRNHFEVKA